MDIQWVKLIPRNTIYYLLVGVGLCFVSTALYAGNEREPSWRGKTATLAQIAAANQPYKNVEKAIQDGYISSVDMGAHCSTAAAEGHPAQLGAMGYHFVKLEGFGEADVNFHEPNVLVYVPRREIKRCSYTTDNVLSDRACRRNLQLAAVEDVVFAHHITSADGTPHWDNIPTYLGQEFYYLHDNPETTWVDEAHGFPPHYALHIWLYKFNPAGLFTPWNPKVSCPAAAPH